MLKWNFHRGPVKIGLEGVKTQAHVRVPLKGSLPIYCLTKAHKLNQYILCARNCFQNVYCLTDDGRKIFEGCFSKKFQN
jgi:hypothetical protein